MAPKKSSIDLDLIRKLAKLLNEEDLTEIEVEEDELSIRLSRDGTVAMQPMSAPAVPSPPAPVAAASSQPTSQSEPTAAGPSSGDPVPSPMVGTAYHSPSPDADPFVTVGASVKKGETIMIVEAMKTMNQIPALRNGVVASIDIEDGQPVEFGQSLITLE